MKPETHYKYTLTIELFGAIVLALVPLSFCSRGPLLQIPLDVVTDGEPNTLGFNSVFVPNKPVLAADWLGALPNKLPDWLVTGKELVIPVIPVAWLVELAVLPKALPVRPETLLSPNRPVWLVEFADPNKPDWLDVPVGTAAMPVLPKLPPD